jgi:hypothetical protein
MESETMSKVKQMVGMALGLVIAAQAVTAAEIAAWYADEAELGGRVVVSDRIGVSNLVAASDVGVAIGAGAPGAKDSKALVFDGKLEAPVATQVNVASAASVLKVTLRVKPTGHGDRQTIIKQQPYFELRVIPDTKQFNFITWGPDNKTYTSISIPAIIGDWNTIEGVVDDKRLVLVVNGKRVTAPLKAPTSLGGAPRRVEIGSAARLAQTSDVRAFVGSLSEIVIAEQ